MNRYWAFAFTRYYPNGGMDDFRGHFDTLDAAKRAVTRPWIHGGKNPDQMWKEEPDDGHVFDSQEGRIVLRWSTYHGWWEEKTDDKG